MFCIQTGQEEFHTLLLERKRYWESRLHRSCKPGIRSDSWHSYLPSFSSVSSLLLSPFPEGNCMIREKEGGGCADWTVCLFSSTHFRPSGSCRFSCLCLTRRRGGRTCIEVMPAASEMFGLSCLRSHKLSQSFSLISWVKFIVSFKNFILIWELRGALFPTRQCPSLSPSSSAATFLINIKKNNQNWRNDGNF